MKKVLSVFLLGLLLPALCFAQPANRKTAAPLTEFTTSDAGITAAVKTLIGAAAGGFKGVRQEDSKKDDALAKAWKYKGLLWLKDDEMLDRVRFL